MSKEKERRTDQVGAEQNSTEQNSKTGWSTEHTLQNTERPPK